MIIMKFEISPDSVFPLTISYIDLCFKALILLKENFSKIDRRGTVEFIGINTIKNSEELFLEFIKREVGDVFTKFKI
ncbi:MAG: hypothetical protein ACOC1K_02180 [Nanoarchaeota archaeon]